MPVEIRIGDFVRNHLEKIVDYCRDNTSEINNLMNREYSRNILGIEANYSFLALSNEAVERRYWNTEYTINGNEYKFCSQLGGRNPIQNGLTRSQREGQKFLEYFKNKNILLEEYQNVEINFIVGENNNEPFPILPPPPLSSSKNIILYGVPGVGKTHNINRLINLIEEDIYLGKEIFEKIMQNSESNEELMNENLKSRVVFTTFHQSFAYEDFIEGFRPNNAGQIILRDGIFKTICEDAKSDKYNNYYLVIDEINRGNISKIFGELITLIEESKRDKLEISLPYSQEKFTVPSNLFIIGTMNSTDKSIALIDIALRRRFIFLELKPNETLIQNSEAKNFFIKLNAQLEDDYKVGHSYFMGENIDLEFVKEYKIKPLLKEYFYGNSEKLNEIFKIIEIRE